jgi:hypothetical protein
MSKNNVPIEAVLAKGLNCTINTISKVVPVNRIPSVYCFNRWLDSHYKMAANPSELIQADYYNGSENDIVNLFLEILNLAKNDHCHNGHYVLERLKFLANEGLHITEVNQLDQTSFKVTAEQADDLIVNLAKKTKKVSKAQAKKNIKKAFNDYKKSVKSSVDLKPIKKKSAKRLKRDNKGRFIKNK